MSRLRAIQALGQSVWLDDIGRALVEDGGLRRLVERDGVSGVTSNPAIFEQAIRASDRYDAAIARAARDDVGPEEAFRRMAFRDVRDGADVLAAVHRATGGRDGLVSFELPPALADDAHGTVAAARRVVAQIGRPNLLVKVPGTEAGVAALEELTTAGVSVNVTLLFSVARYVQAAEAYLRGLERRVAAGAPVHGVASVASFFVSRVDAAVDPTLERSGRPDLVGRTAVANAHVAYEAFAGIFRGHRWAALAARGARVQRPLWASTSAKNPAFPDVKYVDALIGPHTVTTLPPATLAAARERATPARTLGAGADEARRVLAEVAAQGVDLVDLCERRLLREGLVAFAASHDRLLESIGRRMRALAGRAPAQAPG